MAGVIEQLGLRKTGGTYANLKRHVDRLGLDVSHFRGQGWAKGRSFPDRNETPIEELLARGRSVGNWNLKRRLIKAGLKEERCGRCGNKEWMGEKIPLDLEHIDGDNSNYALENLMFLCPNCHRQTPTWGRKNRSRASIADQGPRKP